MIDYGDGSCDPEWDDEWDAPIDAPIDADGEAEEAPAQGPAPVLCRRALCEKLLVLPRAIAAAEAAVLEAEQRHRRQERFLQQRQDALLLDGCIDGKNAEVRSAQLRIGSAAAGDRVEEATVDLAQRRVTLNLLKHQHSSLRAIARLLAAGGE